MYFQTNIINSNKKFEEQFSNKVIYIYLSFSAKYSDVID